MVNFGNLTMMTKEEFLTSCHSVLNIPSLVILFISFIIFFLLFGLILVKKSRGKILLILGLTVLCSGIVFLFLYLNPILTQNFVEWLKNLM